jgi:hypothetical protein
MGLQFKEVFMISQSAQNRAARWMAHFQHVRVQLTHVDVWTCFDHLSFSTAVFRGVANACHRDAVHKNRCAAFGGDPRVGSAAFFMFSSVANAKYRTSVYKDVR